MSTALVPTGRITLCCGAHAPQPGTASLCECCAECVTNAEAQNLTAAERGDVARRDRIALADHWSALRLAARRTVRIAENEDHEQFERRVRELIDWHLRDLDEATHHAVMLPEPPEFDGLPEPEALAVPVPTRLSPWFTKPPLVAS